MIASSNGMPDDIHTSKQSIDEKAMPKSLLLSAKPKKYFSSHFHTPDETQVTGKINLEKYADVVKKYGDEIKAAVDPEQETATLAEHTLEIDIEQQFKHALSDFR